MSTIFTLSIILTKISHPAYLASLLIRVAFFTSLFLGVEKLSWLIFLLVLVFLGGVIVVILFVVAVCGNEKIFFSQTFGPLIVFRYAVVLRALKPRIGVEEGFINNQISNSLYQIDAARGYSLFMLILVLCLVVRVGVSKLESGPLVKRL